MRSCRSFLSLFSVWMCDMLVFHHGACQHYRGRGLYDFSGLFNMRRRWRQAGCHLINKVVALYARIALLHGGSAVRVSLSELKSSADGQYANCCLCNQVFLNLLLRWHVFLCVCVCVERGRRASKGCGFYATVQSCQCDLLHGGVGAAVVCVRRRRKSLTNLETDFFFFFSLC